MYKILSIDGGGIRGVIPAFVLAELERAAGKPVAEMFDMVVGTSTGGIIALGATVPGPSGNPKLTAQDMVDLYADHGREIFSRSFFDKLSNPISLLDEKYDEEALEDLLKEYLGENTMLSNLIGPDVIVTAYDIEKRAPYYFKSRLAKNGDYGRDHKAWVAGRCTSAAPTYFEPKLLNQDHTGDQVRRALVDGGVFVNNPAMCALAEALDQGHSLDDIMLVSLGTGVHTRKIPFREAKDWGLAGWVAPLISVMMDGVADAAHFQLLQLLKERDGVQRYYRFETALDKASDEMDDASGGNIRRLKEEGADILSDQSEEIAKLIPYL